MGQKMFIQDIDEPINFLEKKANGKSRPVYVEFVRYNTRELIYENKKSLKNQGFLEQKVLVAK